MEAGMFAIRKDRPAITQDDFLAAITKIRLDFNRGMADVEGAMLRKNVIFLFYPNFTGNPMPDQDHTNDCNTEKNDTPVSDESFVTMVPVV